MHAASTIAASPMAAAPTTTVPDPLGPARAALAAGRPVVLTGVPGAGPAELLLPAAAAATRTVAWMVRHTSGLLFVALTADRAAALGLPPMTRGTDPLGTAVTVDAAAGVTTGISAADRGRTLRLLADPATRPDGLVRPGHVIPLVAAAGGTGPAETAVDLLALAGATPVGVLATLVDTAAEPLDARGALAFAAEHDLVVVPAEAVVAARHGTAARIVAGAGTVIPTRHGRFRVTGFADPDHGPGHGGGEHLAMEATGPGDGGVPLVRVHVECLLGDALGSSVCECRAELTHGLAQVAEHGGVLVYVKGHRRQRARAVGLAARMLVALGVREARVPAGDVAAVAALHAAGIDVTAHCAAAPAGVRQCWPRSA